MDADSSVCSVLGEASCALCLVTFVSYRLCCSPQCSKDIRRELPTIPTIPTIPRQVVLFTAGVAMSVCVVQSFLEHRMRLLKCLQLWSCALFQTDWFRLTRSVAFTNVHRSVDMYHNLPQPGCLGVFAGTIFDYILFSSDGSHERVLHNVAKANVGGVFHADSWLAVFALYLFRFCAFLLINGT